MTYIPIILLTLIIVFVSAAKDFQNSLQASEYNENRPIEKLLALQRHRRSAHLGSLISELLTLGSVDEVLRFLSTPFWTSGIHNVDVIVSSIAINISAIMNAMAMYGFVYLLFNGAWLLFNGSFMFYDSLMNPV